MTHQRQRALWGGSMAMATAVVALLSLLALLHSTTATAAAASPTGGGTVLINEFFVRGTAGNLDWVEIINPTGGSVDITGWYVDDTAACGAGTSFLGATMLPAGGTLAITEAEAGANFGLNTTGEPIVLCTGTHTLVDSIGYGNVGGAPLHPAGMSTARVGSAQETGNDAADFNMTANLTKGTANNVPTTNLGSSLILNEVDITQVAGNDAIEIYNPTGAAVDLLGWSISDGGATTTFTQTNVVPANGYATLLNGTHFSWGLGSNDVLHLFNPSGVRVDQLGWGAEVEDNCFARVPDGAGPHTGYDFASSGGNSTLLDQPCTLGGPNAVTFVYHDLEDVVMSGETVYIAGDFNGWNPTANPLTADGGFTTFTVTLPLAAGTYGYKYLVGAEWDWLNTDNRSITVASSNIVHSYRHVVPGWANLQSPATMTGTAGQATSAVTGQLYVNNVTNPAGVGRGLQAQVGLGNSGDLNSWDWFPMSFDTQIGNNDQFAGAMTPDTAGVYSYTTRFNGNWGPGNPHSAWYYGDLDGNASGGGFSLNQTGVITVAGEPVISLRISQFYGAHGNVYTHDYIEIFNYGPSPVSLDGLSLQYTSATGTGNFGGSSGQLTELPNVLLQPGRYFLVQQIGTTGGSPLPTPDYIDPTPINLSGSSGKVVLVTGIAPLGCNGGSTPCNATQVERMIDLVGFGTANYFEGSGAAPTLTNTTAGHRNEAGCIDTDNNNSDFTALTPAPRNTATPANLCVPGVMLSLDKTVNPTVNVLNGDTVTYTLVLANDGGITETAAILTDVLPADVTFNSWVSQPAGAVSSSTAVTWTGEIAPEEEITLIFQADYTGPNTGTVVNTAYFSGTVSTGNDSATFTAGFPAACGTAATLISEVQGTGASSPMDGSVVTVEALVTAAYQSTASGSLRGFFLMEEADDFDGTAASSEGVFVFNTTFPVNVGDLVRVTATVDEFSGLTELTTVTEVVTCDTAQTLTPVPVTLPFATLTEREQYEGMLIAIEEELFVTDSFRLGRYGQIRLAPDDILAQPTNVVAPGAPANALQDLNNRSFVTIDDANTLQNQDIPYPQGGLTYTNTVRGGDSIPMLVGVMDHFENSDTADDYRIHPTMPLTFTANNTRPSEAPDVGGTIRVASFNVLNYFTTIDTGPDICGPAENADCRGADSLQEFERQRVKTLNALMGLDADIIGLMEIENQVDDEAVIDLVTGLNDLAGAGTYDYIDTGVIGDDTIKVALIYRTATVIPVGTTAILDNTFDPDYQDDRNRPALTQTFEDLATGELITVIVNHLKSKSCGGATGDDADQGDGQGCWNFTRNQAMGVILDWINSDPTETGSDNVLIIGDLNSYAMEAPIMTAINDGAFTNLLLEFQGPDAYGYSFDGQWGYLDHALASAGLLPFVTGAADWHINSDEPIVFDYNTEFKSPAQIISYFGEGEFRTSDHDPVIIGLDLTPPVELPSDVAITKTVDVTTSQPGGDVTYYIQVTNVTTNVIAEEVLISDEFDGRVTIMDINASVAGTEVINGNLYTFLVDELLPGETVYITASVKVTSTIISNTTIDNTATVTETEDTNTSNNSSSVSFEVEVPVVVGEPDIAIGKTADVTSTAPGMTVTYVLQVVNLGEELATGIVVTDILDSLLDVVLIESNVTITNSGSGNSYVWQLPDLATNEWVYITVTVVVSDGIITDTTIANTATVSTVGESNTGNNSSTTQVDVVVPVVPPVSYNLYLPVINREP